MIGYVRNGLQYIKEGGLTVCDIQVGEGQGRFKGKTILVTGGGSRGIGHAVARFYIREGARVIITGRNTEKLANVQKELGVDIMEWDIRDTKAAALNMRTVYDKYGDIDILINNAGVYDNHNFLEMKEEDYDQVMDTNLKGTYFLTQAYVNEGLSRGLFQKQKQHNIAFVVSNRSVLRDVNPYGISKWGLLCFVKGLAEMMCKYHVMVNGVSPGMTASDINGIDVTKNAFNAGIPDKRIASAEEVAEVILFLTGSSAKHIIGEIITVDGGEAL